MDTTSPLQKSEAVRSGLLAGVVASLAMTLLMLLLAWKFRIATPLVLVGDRLSVFIPPRPFLGLMGKVGGYNHLKQLGVSATALGQIVVGALGGLAYGLARRGGALRMETTAAIFVLLPLFGAALVLWPVLGTHYGGLPMEAARIVTLLGLAMSFLLYERMLVASFDFLTRRSNLSAPARAEFTPSLGRRRFLLGVFGLVLTGGIVALGRRLFRIATFSYDGTQYKGDAVQPITPNEQFYCVTKNVVDPRVNEGLWHLEVAGLVQNPRTYRMHDFRDMPMIDQETTLMCISNGLDGGLMSNALWRGISMSDLLEAAGPLPNASRVKLYGVDNYSDTVPLEKALQPTTLIVFRMNGRALAHRHGFPARAIVPGYFGEKHVKWLTRIEVTDPNSKGFYEKQGWGPNFIVPTRSRIDVPANESWIKVADARGGILVKGVAFAGDRGISRVELSFDDGASWTEAPITYPGTKLTWALWRFQWRPAGVGDYALIVRATDRGGQAQRFEPERPFTSGVTGFHKIAVHVFA